MAMLDWNNIWLDNIRYVYVYLYLYVYVYVYSIFFELNRDPQRKCENLGAEGFCL